MNERSHTVDEAGHDRPLAWITGAGGLIGSHLAQAAPPDWRVAALTRTRLDLTDDDVVARAFAADRPALILHCAALSKTTACEADPELAVRLNVEVTRRLGDLAADIPFVFFSSDLVFDGAKGNYRETDAVNPLSVYAVTKVAAEACVLRHRGHTVVRTSLNGGISPTGDRGFNEELRRAWQNGRALNLFTDEFRCPLPACITARAVWELVARGATGLFHLAGRERLSRWEIGERLAARWPHLQPKLTRGSLRDYQGPPRSPDTSLDCAKVQRLLSFPLPGLTDWLAANPDEPF